MEYKAIWFYYLRDNQNRPLITICLLKDNKDILYRGVAICSPKDNPNKKVGKAIALGRAKQAMVNNEESGDIDRYEAVYILDQVNENFLYKSSNCPTLTEFEVKLLY